MIQIKKEGEDYRDFCYLIQKAYEKYDESENLVECLDTLESEVDTIVNNYFEETGNKTSTKP